jgi:hypothetical protein
MSASELAGNGARDAQVGGAALLVDPGCVLALLPVERSTDEDAAANLVRHHRDRSAVRLDLPAPEEAPNVPKWGKNTPARAFTARLVKTCKLR